LIPFLATRVVRTIMWVKVEKPVFDLVGVVLGSLSLAGLLAVAAALLGSAFGIILIRRTRRLTLPPSDAVSLHLDAASHQV
jgi:hypothetical protein